jgi:hypothetical protein
MTAESPTIGVTYVAAFPACTTIWPFTVGVPVNAGLANGAFRSISLSRLMKFWSNSA